MCSIAERAEFKDFSLEYDKETEATSAIVRQSPKAAAAMPHHACGTAANREHRQHQARLTGTILPSSLSSLPFAFCLQHHAKFHIRLYRRTPVSGTALEACGLYLKENTSTRFDLDEVFQPSVTQQEVQPRPVQRNETRSCKRVTADECGSNTFRVLHRPRRYPLGVQ